MSTAARSCPSDQSIYFVPRCLPSCKYGPRDKRTGYCPRKYEKLFREHAQAINSNRPRATTQLTQPVEITPPRTPAVRSVTAELPTSTTHHNVNGNDNNNDDNDNVDDVNDDDNDNNNDIDDDDISEELNSSDEDEVENDSDNSAEEIVSEADENEWEVLEEWRRNPGNIFKRARFKF